MRHAAGQLTDRLHLLRLAQRLFGLHPIGDLLLDPLLERLVQQPELAVEPRRLRQRLAQRSRIARELRPSLVQR